MMVSRLYDLIGPQRPFIALCWLGGVSHERHLHHAFCRVLVDLAIAHQVEDVIPDRLKGEPNITPQRASLIRVKVLNSQVLPLSFFLNLDVKVVSQRCIHLSEGRNVQLLGEM